MKKNIIIFLIFLLFISIWINIYFLNSRKVNDTKYTTVNLVTKSEEKKVNNIELIKNINEENVSEYKKKMTLPMSMLFYALKNNNKKIWDFYWLDIINKLDYSRLDFTKEELEKYLSNVFYKIKNNQLELDIKNKYLLDWGIFFSSANIEKKIDVCKKYYSDKDNKKLNIQKCINFSYYYKAIVDKNSKICNNIDDKWTGNHMKEDCIELLK